MRAIVYAGPGRVAVEEVPDPRLEEPHDALVRVSLSAICGTDLHFVHGQADMEPGTVLGHEFVGDVIAVGSAVRGLRAGERVLGSDFTACGACWWCRRGDHWECPERQFFGTGTAFGKALAGAQAEIVRVPQASTVLCPLPPGCAPERAIFVGDSLATGFAAAERGGVSPGDTVVIMGGGAVGQMASLACQAVGAAVVIVVDLVDDRRALAAAQGALSATPEEVEPLVRRLTAGRGADVAVDAVGGARVLDAALTLVRPRGTVVSVGAHFDASFALPVRRAFAEELTVTFAIGDAMRLRDRLLPLVATGVIDPTVVVTERVGLSDVPAAYERFARHEAVKILIHM
ncbi:MAG TPA: alcohol dehydrogenase catalytic domain-containing protein [Acidimicrobiia bacterium]|nr:alcohol dehydrogenase catalytic domain-containing protein [Acidimicrobiia bacterium]